MRFPPNTAGQTQRRELSGWDGLCAMDRVECSAYLSQRAAAQGDHDRSRAAFQFEPPAFVRLRYGPPHSNVAGPRYVYCAQ